MKLRNLQALVAAGLFAALSPALAQTTLNVVTAGDQNMVDYVNNYLAPKFEAMNPGVKVRAVGTGPGDAGSQKIYEKLSAQQKAGSAAWDVDVAVVHQRGAATMVNEKLLMPYRDDVAAGKLVSRDSAKNALGANVDGYVLPMFHSQIAFAYNPDVVKSPPKSFAELNEWVKKNPKQFGYNGVKGGMSGVGFVTAWVSANSGIADKLEKGPYDPASKAAIDKALMGLKDFNQYKLLNANGQEVMPGFKQAFCLMDVERTDPSAPRTSGPYRPSRVPPGCRSRRRRSLRPRDRSPGSAGGGRGACRR